MTDEQGYPDSWAFVVLAEQYLEEGGSNVQFLGWQAQPVRYDPESPAYLGTKHTGSDAAEREAMFWASFWRLTTNDFTPTIFCSDSHTTCHQTTGQMGVHCYDETFRCLRGVQQALAAFLPADMLQVRHVRGHADDPWNDLADHLAKKVRTAGYYLPRHPTSLHRWKPLLPFMWMFLSHDAGLPPLCQEGFTAAAPELPKPFQADDPPPRRDRQRNIRLTLSLATANVQSLQRQGEDKCGYPGKIQYLREQFKAHGLQVLGIQEARTIQMCGMSDNVLRISSGHYKGLYGTELWFDLDRPYGYEGRKALRFAKHHFVVLHADPKILIVRAQADYFCAIFVAAHAPHSGYSRQDREQWWQQLSTRISECDMRVDEKLYVMIDANASSGPCDNQHVGPRDDKVTSSTCFLRDFLEQHDLCLPGTFPIHEGHGDTWTTPDGCHGSRIDYVAVPVAQGEQCVYSAVLDTMDLGTATDDHNAVGLQLEWYSQALVPQHRSQQGATCDRDQIRRGCLAASLSNYKVPEWSCDIEAHVQHYNTKILHHLAEQCPRRKQGPKKSYITEEIWTFRSHKLALRSRLKELRARSRQNFMQLCFQLWKCDAEDATQLETSQRYQATLLCSNVHLYAQLRACTAKLKRALSFARFQHLRTKIDELPQDLPAGQILKVVKQIAGPTNPKKQITAVFPAVKQEDGSIAVRPQQASDRWIQFFSDMEGGVRCQPDTLRNKWRANLARFQQPNMQMALHELPSLCDLERAFARVASGKAIGQDGLPPELCRTHPAELAKASYSQLLKLALHGQEDLSHKGGYLVQAWKGKGAKDTCSSYRSLLISSHQGKALHRALRQHHSGLYEQWMQSQQIGGRSHIPVGMGIHMVRSFLRIDRQRGHSSGVLFLDLREAFYRVLRPLALQVDWTDEELAVIVRRLRLPAGTLQELYCHLREPCALEQAGLPGYIQNYVTAIHTDTWFQMRNQQDMVRTTIGSRPGDSYADVVFGFLWSRVLKEVEKDLHTQAALEAFPLLQGLSLYDHEVIANTERPFLGPNWMDDLAVCVSASTSDQLVEKLGPLVSTLLESCCNHGMTPNLAAGKTELLLALRGRGSRKWRRHFFGPQNGQQFFALGEHTSFKIHVVGAYKHLGGIIHHSGSQSKEAQQRLAVAHQALSRHRKLLLHNPKIAFSKRKEMFESLVLSTLTFGMESWHLPDQRSKLLLHHGIMKLYKRFLRLPHDAPVTDDQVLARAELPSPTELLRRARLRYLSTLYQCEEVVEWGLFFHDLPWRELVRDDLHWMWKQLWNSSSLQDPERHFPAWEYLLRYHGGYWKRLVARAFRHAIQQQKNRTWIADFHQRVFQNLQDHGHLSVAEPTYQVPFEKEEHYGCMQCKLRCINRAGEGAHFFKVHGVINPNRYLFDTSQCPACLKEYHTVARVQIHLRHSDACREQLQGERRWCRPVPGIGSQLCQEQQKRHDGLVPHLQAQGPLQRPGPRRARDLENGELIAQILDCVSLPRDFAQMEGDLRARIESFPISWTDYVATLQFLREHYNSEIEEDTGFSIVNMHRMLDRLSDPAQWAFLNVNGKKQQTIPERLGHYECWCDTLLAQEGTVWTPTSIPGPIGKERIILHAFSGRRRPGDYQWYLESLLSTGQEGMSLYVVSLDIVIDSKYGDLADPETRGFWLSHIFKGFVHGFLGGPPCCTFSKARGVAMTASDHRRPPRPVRSATELWGMASLRLRELCSVLDGNVLLSFCVEAIFALTMIGRQGLLEHPAEPEEEGSPSIWKTPIIQLLLRLPNVQRIDFAQGLFGATSRKPTTILAANSPDLIQILRKWHVTPDNPTSVNIGKDQSGQFRTAHLKEYPPALCAALAESTWNATCIAPGQDSVQMPLLFQEICRRLTVTEFGAHIGPDCVH